MNPGESADPDFLARVSEKAELVTLREGDRPTLALKLLVTSGDQVW